VEGNKLFNQGKYQEAITQYAEHLEYNPEDVQSIYNQGRAYEELGEFDKSLENYEQVVEIDPQHANALMSIGKYHFRNNSYADASFYFTKAAEIKKSDPQVFFLKARAHHKLGETQVAMEAYNEAISKNRDYGEAYLYRGALKVYQGNKSAGCNDLRTAQSLNVPDAENALKEYCN
jgi:tetratricopeptide (TPR) repeat protein